MFDKKDKTKTLKEENRKLKNQIKELKEEIKALKEKEQIVDNVRAEYERALEEAKECKCQYLILIEKMKQYNAKLKQKYKPKI